MLFESENIVCYEKLVQRPLESDKERDRDFVFLFFFFPLHNYTLPRKGGKSRGKNYLVSFLRVSASSCCVFCALRVAYRAGSGSERVSIYFACVYAFAYDCRTVFLPQFSTLPVGVDNHQRRSYSSLWPLLVLRLCSNQRKPPLDDK